MPTPTRRPRSLAIALICAAASIAACHFTGEWPPPKKSPAETPVAESSAKAAVAESSAEAAAAQAELAGWTILFDGVDASAWRGFKQTALPSGWAVEDGCLVGKGGGGDIVTVEEYGDFVLELEWKVAPGGNSGIFFRVDEDHEYVWQTGPEMQVLDNALHADGKNPLTSAGSNYALHAPARDMTRPAGEFNVARLEVFGHEVKHFLNGELLLEYELLSPEWVELVAASKFGAMPHYGRNEKGRIALQDHGDPVWYRNIRILPFVSR